MLPAVWVELSFVPCLLRYPRCGDPLHDHKLLHVALGEVFAYHLCCLLLGTVLPKVVGAAPFYSLSTGWGIRHTFWLSGFEDLFCFSVFESFVI